MSKQLTFGERCELMFQLATALADCSQQLERMCVQVRDEAKRMAAANNRFAKRRAERTKARR